MEILFENPIVLIILLGVISSLFRNKNKVEKEKAPQTRPAEKGNRPFDELKDIFQEFSRPLQEEAKPIRQYGEDHREKINEVKEKLQTEYLEKVEESYLPKHEERPQTLQATKPQPQTQLKVDESKIVDAVIWSEILGPPRAKKPRANHRIYKKY